MARCLFVVEDTFFIKGRGLVLVPGIVLQGDERLRVGDPILLKRPDGSFFESAIGGIEMIYGTPPSSKQNVHILLKDLTKEDVPIGSEVWSTTP
jgi:translation elongation factor EF-Tu-like GTPase